MEIFQQCLTELLRVVVLVIIAGFGVLARMYLVPLLKSWVEKAKSAADLAGIDLTAEQIEQAKEIMAALDASIKRVAVVVSPSIEQVRQIEAAGFDYIQIHGEIPETEAEAAIAIPILKAFNVSDMGSYEKYHNDSRIAGYVFDAIEPGSGKTFDWKLVDNIPRDEKLLLLAGGLNPDNVRMAIEAVHPDGVDVSSGVENDNGAGKNPDKIHDFVAAIKS